MLYLIEVIINKIGGIAMFEMDENQKALFDDLTDLQQRMSINNLSGLSASESHREAGGVCKNEANRRTLGGQILANPCVKLFLDSMKSVAINNAVMSRQEMLEELSTIARTNNNDLIEWGYRAVETVNEETGKTEVVQQSFWTLRGMDEINPEHMKAIEEVSVGKDGLKFKRTSKLSAMKQLAELNGYNSANKLDLSSSDGTMTPKNFNDFYGKDDESDT